MTEAWSRRIEALERLARGLLSDVRGAGLAEVARGVAPLDSLRARSLAHEAVALIGKSGSGSVTSSGRLVAAQVMSGTDAVPHALALAELAVLSLEGATLEVKAIARGLRAFGEWRDVDSARPFAKRLLARLPVQNLPGAVQSFGVKEGLARLNLLEQVLASLRGSIDGPYLGSAEALLAWQCLRPEDAEVALGSCRNATST